MNKFKQVNIKLKIKLQSGKAANCQSRELKTVIGQHFSSNSAKFVKVY